MSDEHTNVLVRLPRALKGALQREAYAHKRSMTAEIAMRLENSLQAGQGRNAAGNDSYPLARATVMHAAEGQAFALTDLQRAMLDVFARLPPEKQLALLSLFK